MALLSDKDAKKNSSEMQKGIAQLGGLGAGTLLGMAASYPLDSQYQKKVLKQSIENTRLQEHSENRWRTLFKLYDGSLRLDDLPEADRELYEKLLAENKDELNYLSHRPDAKREALENMARGRVTPLFENTKVPMTKSFLYKVRHPVSSSLIGLAAIAGGYGAGSIYDHYNNTPEQKKKIYYK